MVGKMKKILIIALLSTFSTSSIAQVVYYYNAPPMIVQPAPVVVQPPIVVQPTPVIVQPAPVCATYVDPYDLFGQLFGDPDLIQVCY